jgi:hypothetical protein
MSVDITQLVIDRYHIDQKRKEIVRLNNEIDSLQKGLIRRCTHPTSKTEEKYHSGGYDYLSSVTITKTCTICDKVLESYDDPKHRGSYA